MTTPGYADLPPVQAAAERLAEWEARLDPARPERCGMRVIAYGEISASLEIPDALFEGLVAKRMTGFRDEAAVHDYCALVPRYLDVLRTAGVRTVATLVVPTPRRGRTAAVYLVQPLLSREQLGNVLLPQASRADLQLMIASVLDRAGAVLDRAGPEQATLDAQLANWWFGDGIADPVLFDVGTPFMRLAGHHLLDSRTMLAAVPPGVRQWYVWRRTGEKYMDGYFARKGVALDLLGNFVKEGVKDRIAEGLVPVNAWLGSEGPLSEDDVLAYYRQDAATLELFLRARRLDRWVRAHVLRRGYDFVLPGTVRR